MTEIDADHKPGESSTCADGCATTPSEVVQDEGWRRAARAALWLSWASLLWMTAEGAVGLYAGVRAGSVSLIGWALSSVVEGLASVIVIWRLTGSRTLSETSERTAQKAVAVSFWLLAPYVTVESARNLVTGHHADTSRLGIALTAASLLVMRCLGGQSTDSGQGSARQPPPVKAPRTCYTPTSRGRFSSGWAPTQL